MSTTETPPFTPSGPTDTEKNVLTLLFGNKTCIDNPITKFIWYFGFAIVITILFFALSCAPINRYINGYISNTNGSLALRVIIFFLLFLLLDWLFNSWRQTRPICPNR